MKKIILTNNSILINEKYDEIYTDSPYLVEKYKDAKYLNSLLNKSDTDKAVNEIRIKGYKINKDIVETFFPNYKNRDIEILNIRGVFTNVFINTIKLFKLINLYPNSEIKIKVSKDELYDYKSQNPLDRYVNAYYWISDLAKVKNIRLSIEDIEIHNFHNDFGPIDNWFLRLVDLDKKILIFNFLKKIKKIRNLKKKIYVYRRSPFIREIEPYLYDLGFNLIDIPKLTFNFNVFEEIQNYEKLKLILSNFFENNIVDLTFKEVLFEMYKKTIEHCLQKEKFLKKYVSKLDKSINIVLTSTLSRFDSGFFAKQLQQNGYKIINVMHGFGTSYGRLEDIDYNECRNSDMTLCFNRSEKQMYQKISPNIPIHPISVVQEAKTKRLSFLKRIFVNKMLKIKDDVNIFYPSNIYPYNNNTRYGFRNSDEFNYEFEKKMISLSFNLNKRFIYKNYPKKCFVDENPLINFAKNLNNIKVIDGNFDFRYVSTIGDIFILGAIGSSSTLTWMLGENKPIIFLYTDKFRFINNEGKKVLEKCFIVVNIDKQNWENDLISILNKPLEDLIRIWEDKKFYRDKFDEEWLLGMNLHAGKLGAQIISNFYLNSKKFVKKT